MGNGEIREIISAHGILSKDTDAMELWCKKNRQLRSMLDFVKADQG